MSNTEIPKGGVKELLKSSDGRRYLAKLQERHKIDILQPDNPLFTKVYGERIASQKARLDSSKSEAQSQWTESKEKKEFELKSKREGFTGIKKFHL